MFDISWTEFLLIGVVALIVIGPKELPGVMRTLGQYTRKMRSMAADFQNQFQEAMREAEMADLKKQVDDIASDIKSYDPLKDVRGDLESVGKDLQSSLAAPAEQKPAEPAPEPTKQAAVALMSETAPALPEAETAPDTAAATPEPAIPAAPEPVAPAAPESAVTPEPAAPTVSPEPAATAAEPVSAERS
ncbi:MAG TPA: Sec-independent protein translocase protein TatB [Xanthobacteraceae bacterium]|jgi:sec-independent protein translocase protein TatB|nr:Sec-independent protein translocase protein TatB [Xanthobacteraceae bacterium]